jgi:DNA-binding MarR family transcriptional regulator
MKSQPLPALDCACATVRRTARLVTQLYSREIGHGVEPTQFMLLSALQARPGLPQAPLGRALGLDKTTLSRNLRLMKRNGWIEPAITADPRERGYRLTGTGTRLLAATKPGWKRAQQKLRSAARTSDWMGDWQSILGVFNFVSNAAIRALSQAI